MWSLNRFARGRSALLRPQKCWKSRSRACKSFLRMVEARSYTRKSTGNALGQCASHLTKGRNAFLHSQRCWRSRLHTLKMFTTIPNVEIVVNKLCQQFPYWNCCQQIVSTISILKLWRTLFPQSTILKLWPFSSEFWSTGRLKLFLLKLLPLRDFTIPTIEIVHNILCHNSNIGIVALLTLSTRTNNSNMGITRGGECFYIPGTGTGSRNKSKAVDKIKSQKVELILI